MWKKECPAWTIVRRVKEWMANVRKPVKGAMKSAEGEKCALCLADIAAGEWLGAVSAPQGSYQVLCIDCYKKHETERLSAEPERPMIVRILHGVIVCVATCLGLLVVFSALQVLLNGSVV